MNPRKWERKAPKMKRGESYEDFMKRYTLYKLKTQDGFDLSKNKDGRYICMECKSEVPFGKSCPGCKKKIDWSKVVLSD